MLDLDNLSSATNHNGGALHFGQDGKLYVAVGENANGSNAQSLSNLLGKLLRLNADGSIPTNNPFYSTASGKNRAIWARGLRNPFTFAIQPGTGRIFIDDVGNALGRRSTTAWPERTTAGPRQRGPRPIPGSRLHLLLRARSDSIGCRSPAARSTIRPAQFPSSYSGDYFFADYCSGWIRRLDSAGSYTGASTFASGITSPVDLDVAPDGTLYYLARGSGTNTGGVYRIQYTLNTPPTITVHPAGQTVTVGDSVTFNVSASGTTPLSYQWQRNGADVSGATSSSYTIAAAQTGRQRRHLPLQGDEFLWKCDEQQRDPDGHP